MAIDKKKLQQKTPERSFTTFAMHPPPATRFYQNYDGSIQLYFETNRMMEMIEWAEKTVDHFRSLARSKGIAVTVADPKTGERKPLEMDEGYRIAMEQQKRLDQEKGIDREAKNNAPDEETEDQTNGTAETATADTQPPQENTEIPEPPTVQ